MEFFIKKNATLPVLKINVIKDGRSDYNRSMRFLSETDIFFSMVDTETDIPRITTRPAGLMAKDESEGEYYVYYQFSPFDTKKVGRYKGQFLFRNDTGVLLLPLNEEIYINVTDSFVLEDMEFQSCYVVDYPCCTGPTPFPPVPPGPTTTSTTIPLTTTSTTSPETTTTSTTSPIVNVNFNYGYRYTYDGPYDNLDVVPNAISAATVFCEVFIGDGNWAGMVGLTTLPLQVGNFVGSFYNANLPFNQGNYIYTTGGMSPDWEIYWVVIDSAGYITEYTLLNLPC